VISLEQVRALEDRVEKTVAYITSLRGENAELGRRLAETQAFIDEAADELAVAEERVHAAEKRADTSEALRQAEEGRIREFESRLADMAERVAAAETRAAELNSRAEDFRKDQAKIEEGIVHALEKLDSFEDFVLGQAGAAEEKVVEKASADPVAETSAGTAAIPAKDQESDVEAPAIGSGIAVKSASSGDGVAKAPATDIETVENELDIF
jgi:chromosome segregation ATPase